ncbi:MAG TPA: hypothetical protein VG796_24445 [Verrucomicrobiales bacterium]|nr:hypothetical protein [Verrucomicrobiales bacterium]
MEHESHPPVKRKHPLPWLCWLWPLGSVPLAFISVLLFWIYSRRHNPPSEVVAEKYPPDDPAWNTFLVLGIIGVVTALGYLWFWYRFAIKRILTRSTWHIGLGLILTGAMFLFVTGWPIAGVVYLVILAVWAKGFTRGHFDKL